MQKRRSALPHSHSRDGALIENRSKPAPIPPHASDDTRGVGATAGPGRLEGLIPTGRRDKLQRLTTVGAAESVQAESLPRTTRTTAQLDVVDHGSGGAVASQSDFRVQWGWQVRRLAGGGESDQAVFEELGIDVDGRVPAQIAPRLCPTLRRLLVDFLGLEDITTNPTTQY
jgi:hypothetical protein